MQEIPITMSAHITLQRGTVRKQNGRWEDRGLRTGKPATWRKRRYLYEAKKLEKSSGEWEGLIWVVQATLKSLGGEEEEDDERARLLPS